MLKKVFSKIEKCNDRNMIIIVIFIFIISSITRSILSCFPKVLTVYADELIYLDISRNIIKGNINVHNIPIVFNQILYPLLLSPFTLIKDQISQINFISILNSILMSSIVFPVFFLCKKVIKDNKITLFILTIVLSLPDFAMTITFMSENLFYPLSVWLFYLVYCFWDCENSKKKVLYCIYSSILCFLLYLTKIVSVYFIFAFIIVIFCDFINSDILTRKQGIKHIIIFTLIFFGLFLSSNLFLSFFSNGKHIYVFNNRIRDFNSLLYCCYAFIFNMMYALIAFLYFPVIYPLFNLKKFSKAEKNTFIFALFSLICAIGITSYMISLKADYPSLYMRQHVRYYSPLFVIFFILFIKQRMCIKNRYIYDNSRLLTILVSFTSIICMVILNVFKLFYNSSHVDGVLLYIFYIASYNYPNINGYDNNLFNISSILIFMKMLFIVFIIVYTILLYRNKYHKITTTSLVSLIVMICVLNNLLATRQYINIYKRSSEEINEAIAINEYINQNNGNVLIINDNGFDNLLDTYITKSVYWVRIDDIIDKLGSNLYIDLSNQTLISNYPYDEYRNLNSVDYIITNSKTIKIDNCDRVKLVGVKSYNIYRNKDKSKIYIKDIPYFPKSIGETRILNAQDGIFYTQHQIDEEGFYVSINKEGALIYGPYSEITSGKYDFTFYYEYSGEIEKDKVIGQADVYLSDMDKVVASSPIYADETQVTLKDVYIEEDSLKAETRIFTNNVGLKFKYMKITKKE